MPAFETTAHKSVPLGDMHRAHNWEYADATARASATGFTSADLKKLALQLDDSSLWVLTATTPTWVQVGGSNGGSSIEWVYRTTQGGGGVYDTSAETSLLNTDHSIGSLTIPGGTIQQGDVVRVRAWGYWVTGETEINGVLRFKVTNDGNTLALATPSMAFPTNEQSYTKFWTLDLEAIAYEGGEIDHLQFGGFLTIDGLDPYIKNLTWDYMRTFDLGEDITFDLTFQWDAVDSLNDFQCYHFYIARL